MLRLVFSVMLICVWSVSWPQAGSISYENTTAIDPARYTGIKGSPMYFKGWVRGNLVRNDGAVYKNVLLNYNGYTGYIEVKAGQDMLEIPTGTYLRAQVNKSENPDYAEDIEGDFVAFLRNVAPRYSDRFVVLLFVSDDIILFKDFSVRIASHTVHDVGRSIDVERFDVNTIYYLMEKGRITQIKPNKKALLGAFSSVDISGFLREERIDPRDESDLLRLAQYYAGAREAE